MGKFLRMVNGRPIQQDESSGGLTWSTLTSDLNPAVVNYGYITNSASLITITLPNTAAVGDTIMIVGKGDGGWKVAAGSGQTIYFGATNSTVSFSSTDDRACIELVCVTANTEWNVVDSEGSTSAFTLTAGYHTAGSSSSSTIQKLTFQTTEVRTTIGATLDSSRQGACGVSGPNHAFISGGFGADTTISKFIFASESEANIAATLDSSSNEIQTTGTYSNSKGYVMCIGASTSIEGQSFASETSVVIAGTLALAQDRGGCCSSSTKGYIGGGGLSVNTIYSLIFSSETTALITTATLSSSRIQLGGYQSSDRGYFTGGDPGTGEVNVIDRLQFSTEIRTTLATTLIAGKRRLTNFSSNLKGYCPGGNSGGAVSSIEALVFSTEINAAISATLAANNDLAAGIQG